MRSIALAAIVLSVGTAHAATLRTATTLHAPVVRLSDLFDDAGANSERVLGPGPAPGGRIVVESAQLGAIAKQFRVDWKPISSGDRAVLERPGRPFPREDVVTAVRSALVAAGASADCDVELVGYSPPLVPADADAQPVASQLEYDAAMGRFSALVSVTGSAMEPINLRVAGRVDDTVELPVATSRLPAGALLRAEDVRMARVRSSLARVEMVQRPQQVAGMQVRHQIATGAPIPLSELAPPALVQRNATVMMVLDSPGIALTAQGQAMEAGAMGERVRVLNPVSRAVLEAEVIGPDRVRVSPSTLPLKSAR